MSGNECFDAFAYLLFSDNITRKYIIRCAIYFYTHTEIHIICMHCNVIWTSKVVSWVCHTSRCACVQRSELSWSFNRARHGACSTSSRAQRADRRPLNDIGARRDRRSVRRCRSVGDIRTRRTSFVRGRLGDWRRDGTLSRRTHCRRLGRHVNALYSCSAKRWWCVLLLRLPLSIVDLYQHHNIDIVTNMTIIIAHGK